VFVKRYTPLLVCCVGSLLKCVIPHFWFVMLWGFGTKLPHFWCFVLFFVDSDDRVPHFWFLLFVL
jgi:hypothetical protein